jgi:hypothetical protein
VDSTETAAGLPAGEREPNGSDTAARPETVPGLSETGDPADGADASPEQDARVETASDASDGLLRPRRRRRRRRPAQAAASVEAGAPGETVSGEVATGDFDAPARADEPPADGAAVVEIVEHGGAETPAEAHGVETVEGAAPDRPVLRLRNRNRRRRRRPAALGLLPGHNDPVATGDGAPPAIAAIRAALAPGQRSFSVPRRQRRHAPLSGEPAASSAGEVAPPTPRTAGVAGNAPPQPRRRRRRRLTDAAALGQTAQAGAVAGAESEISGRRHRRDGPRQSGGERGAGDRGAGGSDRRTEGRGGPRDRGDRRDRDRGGRGAPPRRAEQKLYSVDAIVDRGFEDVEEDGGETRRVHWTIVKRTTADQISRKPVGTVYVVQREGADTEFPTLGTARSAVNKTIVHPEKLTPSKAERAIAKK